MIFCMCPRWRLAARWSCTVLEKVIMPGLVLLPHGDAADDQCGVDGVVQQAEALEGHLHHTAAIDQGVHLLRAFVLVLVHHQRPRRAVAFQFTVRRSSPDT